MNGSVLDFEVREHTPNKRGDGSRFYTIAFRPTDDDLKVLGKGGVHSNHFWMQLPDTGIRIVMDGGLRVTRSGKRVRPDAEGRFPREDPRDPWLREEFTRDVIAESEANIKAYWERKLKAASEGRFYPQHHRTTLNLQVGASSDDAEQLVSDGSMILDDADVDFGNDVVAKHVGLRWTGVSGLSGVTIDSAVLTFLPGVADTGAFVGDWFGQDAESPGTFTTTTSNISDTAQRPRTTATCEGDGTDFTDWGVPEETFTGDGVNTIADIIQELADSYDPDAIVLLHIYTSGTGERVAVAYDGLTDRAPKLDIDYTAGVATAVKDVIGSGIVAFPR